MPESAHISLLPRVQLFESSLSCPRHVLFIVLSNIFSTLYINTIPFSRDYLNRIYEEKKPEKTQKNCTLGNRTRPSRTGDIVAILLLLAAGEYRFLSRKQLFG